MRKFVDCDHCQGKKTCTRGGRSCKHCLAASGRPVNQWAVVRCSYCGGRGKVWVEEEPEEQQAAAAPAQPAEAPAEEPPAEKPKRAVVKKAAPKKPKAP